MRMLTTAFAYLARSLCDSWVTCYYQPWMWRCDFYGRICLSVRYSNVRNLLPRKFIWGD